MLVLQWLKITQAKVITSIVKAEPLNYSRNTSNIKALISLL